MPRVHLRRNQPGVLSADQADESLEFLAGTTRITGDSQLHGGGTYLQPAGNYRHSLPLNGSRFDLTVESGSATLVGEIDGVPNPVIPAGPERRFVRISNVWREVTGDSTPSGQGSAETANYVARTVGGEADDAPLTWMLNGTPVTITLPTSAPEGERIGFVRGNALVTVNVAGGGSILGVDHATGEIARRNEARLNVRHRLATFVRLAGEWRVAS